MTRTDVLRVSLPVLLGLALLYGCSDTGGPAAPSATLAEAPATFGPPSSVRTTPASFDGLRPDIQDDPYNAYDFSASYDGSMLTLVLTEDEMRSMREASKPHRNRMITVGICPAEPRRISQECGDPIWQGSMRLAGSLELPAIPLAACDGWIVVNAAEMFDDRYDGWRNSPCPRPDGGPVGSDGTGDVWPDYSEYDREDPRANIPEPKPQPQQPVPVVAASEPFTVEGSWADRVGPIRECLVTGGTVTNFCFDGAPNEIALLRGVGSHPGSAIFGQGGIPPRPSETEARSNGVAMYHASPRPRWTSETERRATATAYARYLAEFACEDAGGMLRIQSIEVFPAVNPTTLTGAVDGWEYTPNLTQTGYQFGARPVYQWRAACDRQ